MITGGLTAKEEALLIGLLGKVHQPYSHEFFKAAAQLLPVSGLEAVILRGRPDGLLEVFMLRRPEDDINRSWAGKWHCPGTILRVRSERRADGVVVRWAETIEEAYARLGRNELGAPLTNLRFAYFTLPPGGTERPSNLQLVHLADIPDGLEPSGDAWFDVDDLPEDTIGAQAAMVRKVASLVRSGEVALV